MLRSLAKTDQPGATPATSNRRRYDRRRLHAPPRERLVVGGSIPRGVGRRRRVRRTRPPPTRGGFPGTRHRNIRDASHGRRRIRSPSRDARELRCAPPTPALRVHRGSRAPQPRRPRDDRRPTRRAHVDRDHHRRSRSAPHEESCGSRPASPPGATTTTPATSGSEGIGQRLQPSRPPIHGTTSGGSATTSANSIRSISASGSSNAPKTDPPTTVVSDHCAERSSPSVTSLSRLIAVERFIAASSRKTTRPAPAARRKCSRAGNRCG